jgi:hypothetical protein
MNRHRDTRYIHGCEFALSKYIHTYCCTVWTIQQPQLSNVRHRRKLRRFLNINPEFLWLAPMSKSNIKGQKAIVRA